MSLANEEKPAKLVLRDGKTYDLAPLDLNIMCDIEEHFDGKPFTELFRGGSAIPIRYQFWLRLKECQPEMTEKEAGRLITANAMTGLLKDIEDQLGVEEKPAT
jgi:hypothetical protein